ncbi:MAG: 3-deoxy-D-manno-octulosonic acid transferase [Gammaproteobacteria bacterium]|nr:3-deoxy-D-manno-octulosonic acid transferase [Gammaproteobacteria bacterium]
MFRALHLVLSYLCVPFIFAFLLVRGIGDPTYRPRRSERFGFVPRNIRQNCIWIHAVSAGEAIAAARVVESLSSVDSKVSWLITTTTPTGSQEILTRLRNRVDHCYAPYDTPGSVARFLRRTKPKMLLLMETELWPHMVRRTRASGASVYLINARLSEKSSRGYARMKDLTNSMLDCLSGIACQDEDSAHRFSNLGYSRQRTIVTGSIKWDVELPPALPLELQRKMEFLSSRHDCLWIAGSTHPGEEEIALEAHTKVRESIPNAVLILAPRHVNRSAELLELCRDSGFQTELLNFADDKTEVIMVDQMGILFRLYGFAKLAFIGGSLQGTGGHNPIEPAIQGVPIAMGPDRHNFAEICSLFEQQDCVSEVGNADDLASTVIRLKHDNHLWQYQSQQVREVVLLNKGALPKLHTCILRWIEESTAFQT